MSEKRIRIGGASGYWGDTALGPAQLIRDGDVDYLILDYLAEITMSILAKAKSRDAEAGYATDFIDRVIRPFIHDIAERRIKVIANAGGVNLDACRRALETVADEAGVTLRVGTVEGDDLLPHLDELRQLDIRELDSGTPLPEKLMSANAYLGAFPIAAALDAGADIVLTGRCVDSALAAGALIHEFGWQADDLDHLAAGGLVGHVIECGAQATGGNFTDWEETVDGWENTGFPIAEVSADGSFILTKPENTGGKVTPFTAGEQMLYEIGDPARYILPDVTCDFSHVTMDQEGPNRVRVAGARGLPPTDTYKVSATYLSGFSCVGSFVIAGERAAERARRQGEAVLKRTSRMLEEIGLPAYAKTALQLVGTESLFGPAAEPAVQASREVVLRLGVHHPQRDGAEIFSKEFVGAGLSMSPGLTGLAPGRPRATPVVQLFSFLLDKSRITVTVKLDGEPVALPLAVVTGSGAPANEAATGALPSEQPGGSVPLRTLAVARSGDKGDKANIGIIARHPEYLPWIRQALTPAAVKERLAHLEVGRVERFECPGINALNFLAHGALGGGGAASLNLDPQGKTYGQILLDTPVPVPEGIAPRT